ncbi:NAD(P)H-dependent flavin oxidoreductase [Lysobacter enzymogenes]|uniref:Nitronate monooxygenase n=1 Tax=Lysobacter enzymogenes TaxID=69 RepID=A0A3N2RNP0_LYSEN|nr:nitronate monooxygenase [Lysobacter enzymogenes]ROU09057.1 nitronate monooxygenase [Lysobacter enzymogenes]
MWPDRRIQELFGIALPIVQAPMAGAHDAALAISAARAGALGSLPCAMLSPQQAREQVAQYRAATDAPLNLNFFCHRPAAADPARDAAWRERLRPYYLEFGLDPDAAATAAARAPFDADWCALVEELRPQVVSFHFGLPAPALLARVRASGARAIASATSVAEAVWLERQGCDAVIAQGNEAGGHRGVFLKGALLNGARSESGLSESASLDGEDVSTQAGLFALLPRIADAVTVPVIAAGGIFDGRGIAAAFALGAAAVQVGTAYLFCPEATVSPLHRRALAAGEGDDTALTNVFSGRPARGIVNRTMRELGPLSPLAPAFPGAGAALAPLRARAEAAGDDGFMPLWSGQARRAHALGAFELTRELARQAQDLLARA